MRDFKCESCGLVHERYADDRDHTDPCPQCGDDAYRIISPVRCKLDGTDPGFPDAYDKWARDHEKRARVEAKQNAENGE